MIMLINNKGYRFTVDTVTWFAAPCGDREDDYAALRNHCLAPHKVRLDNDMIHTVKRITRNGNTSVSYMRHIYGGMPWDKAFDGQLCHATGYEFSMADDNGDWWNEYYDDTVNRYYYGR